MRQTSLQKPAFEYSDFIVGAMRLGAWGQEFSTAQWTAFIEESIALGLNDFDHADIYGDYTTEADFGKALQENSALREKIQITTKCGIRKPADNRPQNKIKSYDSSMQHIIDSVEQSLRNLQTDYIDVLLLHRPDFLMHPEVIANTFNQLRTEGKVLNFGLSNFSPSQFAMIEEVYPLVTHQVEISINHLNALEDGTLDQLMMKKITPSAWSPLGGGHFMPKNGEDQMEKVVKELCSKYDINAGQLLLAWLKRHPSGIIPVLGTSKIERLKEAIAIKDLKIDSEDWYALYSASKGEKLP